MPSQTDWDQGGTSRQLQKLYLGPSVGWVVAPVSSILNILTGGTTNIVLGTNIVLLNFNGAVTLQLPSAVASSGGAQAQPGTFLGTPISIIDVGGFVSAVNTVTILPFGSELIDGLSSIVLRTPYAGATLYPSLTGGYTLSQ